jgi:hypothetical protein
MTLVNVNGVDYEMKELRIANMVSGRMLTEMPPEEVEWMRRSHLERMVLELAEKLLDDDMVDIDCKHTNWDDWVTTMRVVIARTPRYCPERALRIWGEQE